MDNELTESEWDNLISDLLNDDKNDKKPITTYHQYNDFYVGNWTDSKEISGIDVINFVEDKNNPYDDSATRNKLVSVLQSSDLGATHLRMIMQWYFATPTQFNSRKIVADPFGTGKVDFALFVDDIIYGLIEVERLSKWKTLYRYDETELKSRAYIDSPKTGQPGDIPFRKMINWPMNYHHAHFLTRKLKYFDRKAYPYMHLLFSHDLNCAVLFFRESIQNYQDVNISIAVEGGKLMKQDSVRKIPLEKCYMLDFMSNKRILSPDDSFPNFKYSSSLTNREGMIETTLRMFNP